MNETSVDEHIAKANDLALGILLSAEPVWTGVDSTVNLIEEVDNHTILHAGPPIKWEVMAEIQKRGIISGIIFEGLAHSEEDALKLIEQRKVKFGAASDYGVVGGGVGIVTPSMKLIVCEDKNTNSMGFSPIWEGPLGLVAWGVLDDDAKRNLERIINTLGPALDLVLRDGGGIRIKPIIAGGLQMGDESHSREVAEGLILISELVPNIFRANLARKEKTLCVDAVVNTDRWFHSISMASSMSLIKGIEDIEYCTLISRMAGNGVHFGIKVSGLGKTWFCSDAPTIEGTYLSDMWGPEDAIPWLGESCVMENVGLGALSAAASPSVLLSRGKTLQDAIGQTERMRAICIGTNENYPIPNLNLQGPPIGIEIRKILDTGITPELHGGIISRQGGHIGNGSALLPLDCVEQAYRAFVEKYQLI